MDAWELSTNRISYERTVVRITVGMYLTHSFPMSCCSRSSLALTGLRKQSEGRLYLASSRQQGTEPVGHTQCYQHSSHLLLLLLLPGTTTLIRKHPASGRHGHNQCIYIYIYTKNKHRQHTCINCISFIGLDFVLRSQPCCRVHDQ